MPPKKTSLALKKMGVAVTVSESSNLESDSVDQDQVFKILRQGKPPVQSIRDVPDGGYSIVSVSKPFGQFGLQSVSQIEDIRTRR